MKRISPSFIILLLALPFIFLVMTGTVKFPGNISTTTAQMLYFNPDSRFSTGGGVNCDPSWFARGSPQPTTYHCALSPFSSRIVALGGTAGSSFSSKIAWLASDSNDVPGPFGSWTGNCASIAYGVITACSHASIILGNGGNDGFSGYALTGNIVGIPQLLGQPGASFNFETNPPTTNPIIVGQTYTNTTATYTANIYVYRFGIDVRLAIAGDQPLVIVTCMPSGQNPDPCPLAQVSALNQALSYISQNDLASGTIILDLNIPTSFTGTPYDRYGFGGAWIANQQCLISNTQVGQSQAGGGAIADLGSQCSAHAAVRTNVPNYNYADFSVLASQVTSLPQLQQLAIGNLPSSAKLYFTLNKMGPQYTSSVSADGKTYTVNYAKGETIDIPIIFDIWASYTRPLPSAVCPPGTTGTPPNCSSGTPTCVYGGTYPNCNPAPPPGGNIGNLTGTGPGYASTLGAIVAHVTDAITGLPLSGMSVSINSGGTCSTNYASTTDHNGNWNFTNLSTSGGGSYTVCASGGSGTLTLLFFSFGITYTGNQAGATALPGQTVTVNLPLQPNAYGILTTTSILLIILAMVLFVVVLVIAPTSLISLGGAGARVLRGSRRGR